MIYNIDLGDALGTAHTAVRRASAFMVLGLRSLEQPIPSAVRLEASVMGFFPEPIDDHAKAEIADEYRAWVIGAALRELEQGYSIFIDKIYQGCVIAKGGSANLRRSMAACRRMELKNLRHKLELLRDEFAISSRMIAFTDGIVKARNALTHAVGRVQPDHADENGKLVIKWLGADIEIIGNSTGAVEAAFRDGQVREHRIADPQGASIQIRVVSRERVFATFERIDLAPHDLHEICHSFLLDADNIVGQAASVIGAFGVSTIMPPRTPHSAG